MYDALDTMLILMLNRTITSDKKELKKRAIKLSKRVTNTVRIGLLKDIIDAKNMGEMLDFHIDRFTELSAAAEEISKMKRPGMAIYKGEAYPIDVQMLSAELRHEEDNSRDLAFYENEFTEDRRWILQNETEMGVAAAHALMNFLNLPRIACDIVMFCNRGFTGTRMPFEVERGVARKFENQLNSGNYFDAGHVSLLNSPIFKRIQASATV